MVLCGKYIMLKSFSFFFFFQMYNLTFGALMSTELASQCKTLQ